MGQFSVKISGLSQRIEEEKKMQQQLGSIESDICSVRCSLGFKVRSKAKLSNVLKSLENDVDSYEADMKMMRFVLQNVRDEYEKTENRICGKINDYTITAEDVRKAIVTVGQGLAISATSPVAGLLWMVNEILKDEEIETKSEFGKYKSNIWERERPSVSEDSYVYENGKWVKKEEKEKDNTKKEKTDAQKRKDILESITIWSGSIGKEGSLLHFGKDGDVETDWGNYTYSADFMKAEWKASGDVGLGGLGGEIGVALTAFSAAAGGQWGSDMLGLHGNIGVDVGKAEAKVSGDLKWMDEDGNFDPNVSISGSLEAIAAEVSGEVGVDLAGTEINAKGTVNIGIGAHADIGYKDGKFNFDVGASLGIGVSVDLEIDVSGTVDMIVDHAADIGNAAKEAYNMATEAVGQVADAAYNVYNDVVDSVSDFAGDVADGLKEGWSTVTGWVSNWF